MYGQGHFYCQGCGHAVRGNQLRCSGCGTLTGELIALDLARDQGLFGIGSDIGFDPMDGQFAIDLGDGLAYEPGTGQMDIETPFGDYPI
jgi:hypothetical protein